MKSGKCPKCNQRNVSKSGSAVAQDAEGGGKRLGGIETVVYGCSDCHYTETYLLDSEYPKPLDSYEGWERVSPPASGPFR